MTQTITKLEAKNLLKRRMELFDNYNKLDENCYKDSLHDIYIDGRKDVSEILYKIDIKLLEYVNQSVVGKWMMQIKGMTPYIAAGLLSYLDISNKVCAAQFISYAGLDGKKPHSYIGKIIHDLKHNFCNESGYYYKLSVRKGTELVKNNVDPETAFIRSQRYMMKLFISHLFEEMYREEHNGELPERYNDSDNLIIEPEIPYTK